MTILYQDPALLVCVKPAGVLSTDEPGGVPELLRQELGQPKAELRTVHRLDRVVGGLMVLARSAQAASELSRQIREEEFHKEYLALVHGALPERGALRDLMWRDKARKMSFVVPEPGKDVQEARLRYETLTTGEDLSLVRVMLETGRTHQIRCQFAHFGHPLLGERKYAQPDGVQGLALWSWLLGFRHPVSGEKLCFRLPPPEGEPWDRLPPPPIP